MARSGDCKVNAVWERDVLMTFCDLCLKEINAGNRPTTHFNREGWANLVRLFGETTGRDYDKTQLKNKWDHLKKEWKLWKELKKDDTGLGWDPRRKTIDAPPEWWAEKLNIMPEAKKFRLSGIDPELEDKLDQMYGDVVATGKGAFVPTGDHAFVPTNDITRNVEGEGSSNDVSTQALPSDNAERLPNCDKNTTSNIRGSKKRKKGVTMMRGQISELIDSCNAIASEHSSRHVQPPLSQAIKLLEEMPEVAEDFEFFMHSTQLLEDDKKREIFMTIKPEKKLRFLRFYYASRHE